MTDDVPVIQADRIAAAPYMGFAFRRVLEGECDDSGLVQQFAKHRLATPAPDSENLREAFEAGWEAACDMHGNGVPGRADAWTAYSTDEGASL